VENLHHGGSVNWGAIRSASKEFLVTRETANVLPSLAAFSRMLGAAIELYHSIDPKKKESLGHRIAYRLLRRTLQMVGDVTLFGKKWIRC
jgi:hypothetical protein